MRLGGTLFLLITLLALSAGWLAGTSRARGPDGLDLTGIWRIELGGTEPVTCSAIIDHIPGNVSFNVSFECPDYGPKVYTFGLHYTDTGRIQIDAILQPQTPAARVVRLDGTVAEDGQSFSGLWLDSYVEPSSEPFTATLEGQVVSPSPTLPSPVDITGGWHFSFTGEVFDWGCDVVLQQKGRKLSGSGRCDVFGMMQLGSNRIDANTGVFSLSGGGAGGGIGMEGLAADSNSLSGTWNSSGGFSGTFSAERADVSYINISGEWEAVVANSEERYSISFVQELLILDATVDCGALGSGEFTGRIDPMLGGISLDGWLGDTETSLGGRADDEGSFVVGSLFERRPFPEKPSFRQLIIVPAGQLDQGVLAVDCYPEREGLQYECFGVTNEERAVAIELIVPPTDLPQGVDFALEWPSDLAAYHPTANPIDEVVGGKCEQIERTVEDGRTTFSCLLSADASPGPILMLSVSCTRAVSVAPWLAHLDLTPVDVGAGPALIDAVIVPCQDPEPPRRLAGDANCDGELDSIDAAIVLQLEAGLLRSLSCRAFVDMNQDGRINSVDAAIILQWVAGLLGPPP